MFGSIHGCNVNLFSIGVSGLDSVIFQSKCGNSHVSLVNTLRPRQNGRRFADDTFKCIFLNENVRISFKISLKFVSLGPINNIPALVQFMAWRRPGDKPLSEPMIVSLPTHICVTRPQWVNSIKTDLNVTRDRSYELHLLNMYIRFEFFCGHTYDENIAPYIARVGEDTLECPCKSKILLSVYRNISSQLWQYKWKTWFIQKGCELEYVLVF